MTRTLASVTKFTADAGGRDTEANEGNEGVEGGRVRPARGGRRRAGRSGGSWGRNIPTSGIDSFSFLYLDGDAVGILPSQEGFVVTHQGTRTAVSAAAWGFSLYYGTASLLAFLPS